ncbi:MAG TPA: DUF1003 domain-containing protein, partial [bacterium]|nr:DUF1003 domain-containing protein [bacterium]
GALSAVEADVARKAARHEWIAENVDKELRSNTTYGQRLADKVAAVGGSWAFIIGFTVFLVLWMTINTVILVNRPFDPYPFILLNLCLSTLAALQAPVIMMSQNRLSEIDRKKADMDYRINLKAEIEVASLHEKLDHLLNVQWERMVEMQQLQFEVLSQLAQKHQCEVPPVRHRRDGWAENGQQH